MSLDNFIGKHEGERCFIACNGPSLNDIPVKELEGEIVFGLNRGYKKEGLPITYLVVMVPHVVNQWEHEIKKVKCEVLFTNLIDVPWACKTPFGNKAFQINMNEPLHRGHTVTYPAMQIAYGMGFEKVYLIGCDHSFDYSNTVRDESHHRAVITVGKDPNHFTDDYFGDGSVWLPYSPKMVESNYKEARKAFEKDGRVLMNLSTKTRLPEYIIPRGSFESIL